MIWVQSPIEGDRAGVMTSHDKYDPRYVLISEGLPGVVMDGKSDAITEKIARNVQRSYQHRLLIKMVRRIEGGIGGPAIVEYGWRRRGKGRSTLVIFQIRRQVLPPHMDEAQCEIWRVRSVRYAYYENVPYTPFGQSVLFQIYRQRFLFANSAVFIKKEWPIFLSGNEIKGLQEIVRCIALLDDAWHGGNWETESERWIGLAKHIAKAGECVVWQRKEVTKILECHQATMRSILIKRSRVCDLDAGNTMTIGDQSESGWQEKIDKNMIGGRDRLRELVNGWVSICVANISKIMERTCVDLKWKSTSYCNVKKMIFSDVPGQEFKSTPGRHEFLC